MLQETKILSCDLCNKNQYQVGFSKPIFTISRGMGGIVNYNNIIIKKLCTFCYLFC
jgi:hypothetical protein